MGFEALTFNTKGDSNVAIGYHALQANTISGGNTAVGFEALLNYDYITAPPKNGNTAVGDKARRAAKTAFQNTAVGYEALLNNVDGLQEVAIGFQTLQQTMSITTPGITYNGCENTAVGNLALQWLRVALLPMQEERKTTMSPLPM